jgi:hypothetical protein
MKVGDLVRFKDVSSFAAEGHGSFPHLDGNVGVVVAHGQNRLSGGPLVRVLMNGVFRRFHPDYFQEVLNARR